MGEFKRSRENEGGSIKGKVDLLRETTNVRNIKQIDRLIERYIYWYINR